MHNKPFRRVLTYAIGRGPLAEKQFYFLTTYHT